MRERLNIEGVTLVELLVTMIILGVLVSITIPSLSSWYSGYSLRAAARKIAITLELAKMKAISRNLEYRVEFVGTTFRIARGNSSSGSTVWTPETDYMDLPSGVTIANITLPQNNGLRNAQFNPDGSSSSGGIYLQNSSGDQYSITLTAATGSIRMQRPTTGPGWIYGQ